VLRTPRHYVAGTTAGLLLAAVVSVPAAPAAAAPVPHFATTSGLSGFSNGTLEFVNAANLPPIDVAKVGLGQSAAGVQLPGLGAAATTDQLKQPLLIASKAGKTAYGHASGANAGLLTDETAEPNVLEDTLIEATSPAPSAGAGSLLDIPLSPVATASVLPSSAVANTTGNNACVVGKDISRGSATVANADVLIAGLAAGRGVVSVDDVSITSSREALIKQLNGAGATVGANAGLLSQSTQNLAPITLFAGTPAQLVIKVLAPIQLSAAAGGLPGTAIVKYGTTLTDPTKPILDINGTKLNSNEVFGNGGFKIGLGVADITIGTPAHRLNGLENTSPTQAANGTTASAAADFIRISIPGQLPTPATDPLDGPLAPLNDVLNPVVTALDPLLAALQDALTDAGLNVADVRLGHMEASSTVPAGGVNCAADENPLDESRKDVSATSVTAGDTFTYTLRIPNRGSTPITNVKVVDTYDARLEFISSVPAPSSKSGNKLTYNLGTLEPNEFATIILTFKAPANASPGTRYSNDAVISGTYNGQPITFPIGVDGPTVIGPLTGNCNLSGSTKYASNTHVKKGESFGYFVNVFNSGGKDCANVVVRDKLINGVSFVSCTNSCTRSGQNITWRLGTIKSGQSKVLGVIVRVTASSGRLPNVAIITTTSGTGGKPSTPGPIVGNVSNPSPGKPATLAGNAGGELPRTGLATGAALGGLLLLLTSAALMRRRRMITE
jgi:uncharacterized repeat protein (TIGR01451 family)